MLIIAWIVWIPIWGLLGYFTVKAIVCGVNDWRYARTSAVWFREQKALEKKTTREEKRKDITDNPFEGLL